MVLELKGTNGYTAQFPWSDAKEECYPFLGGQLQLKKEGDGGLPEYRITLVPTEETALSRVSLKFSIPEMLGTGAEDIRLFNAGKCTNDFAQILELKEADKLASRDLFMAASKTEKDKTVALAVTSFDRFYTFFWLENEEISLCWNLEDKTVHAGEEYRLETFAFCKGADPQAFFDAYASRIAEKYSVVSKQPIPTGWSSWSCLYSHINEEKIRKEAEDFAKEFRRFGADLIQMDEGWEKGQMFDVFWTNSPEKFPSGLADLNRRIRDLGMRFGIWMAPGLIHDGSEAFDDFRPHLSYMNGEAVRPRKGNAEATDVKNGSIYVMNIAQDYVKDLIRGMFQRAMQDGVEYFKIDFLVDMLYPAADAAHPLCYEAGYSVELYRELMRIIRETVGEDVFLLSCGAPVGESIGYFDAIRVSPDITWGGAGSDWHPGAWNILRNDAQNALLRNSYHRRVFINDPDAVLLRDYEAEGEKDGLNLSFEEAKMWVSTIALCGGSVLLNEQTARISKERLQLVKDILPPLGMAARPKDFFEYPWCSESNLDADKDTRFVGLYNWGDQPIRKVVDISDKGKVVAVDCFDKTILGVFEKAVDFGELAPHTTKTVCLRSVTGRDQFLYSDDNFYLGVHTTKTSGDGKNLSAVPLRSGNVYLLLPSETAEKAERGGMMYTRVPNEWNLPLYKHTAE